jgi:hypothetical protein
MPSGIGSAGWVKESGNAIRELYGCTIEFNGGIILRRILLIPGLRMNEFPREIGFLMEIEGDMRLRDYCEISCIQSTTRLLKTKISHTNEKRQNGDRL